MKITLELTEEQAELLLKATENYLDSYGGGEYDCQSPEMDEVGELVKAAIEQAKQSE